jgi:ABC-type Co2+ transport system permease subunit
MAKACCVTASYEVAVVAALRLALGAAGCVVVVRAAVVAAVAFGAFGLLKAGLRARSPATPSAINVAAASGLVSAFIVGFSPQTSLCVTYY